MKFTAVCCLFLALPFQARANNARVANPWADSAWARDKSVYEARVDLDGDRRPEHIRLEPFRKREGQYWSSGSYRLRINGEVIFDETGGEKPDGFYIAN